MSTQLKNSEPKVSIRRWMAKFLVSHLYYYKVGSLVQLNSNESIIES